MTRLEGNGAARFIRLIQQHGYNKDIDVALGTVTAAPPAIKIRLDGDSFELDKDDVVVGASAVSALTPGTRVMVLVASGGQKYFVIDKAVTY